MTDHDQNLAADYHDSPICDECGETTGVIQHVSIAWPGGRLVELWLHSQCEPNAIERLERLPI